MRAGVRLIHKGSLVRFWPRSIFSYPILALGSALLWGMIELIALWRSRWIVR